MGTDYDTWLEEPYQRDDHEMTEEEIEAEEESKIDALQDKMDQGVDDHWEPR